MQNTDLLLEFCDAWTIELLCITLKELNNSKLYCYDQNDTTEAVFSFSVCSLNTIWAFIHSIYTLTIHYKES